MFGWIASQPMVASLFAPLMQDLTNEAESHESKASKRKRELSVKGSSKARKVSTDSNGTSSSKNSNNAAAAADNSNQPDEADETELPRIPARRRSARISLQRRVDTPDYRKPKNHVTGDDYQYSGIADDIDFRDYDDPLCATDYVLDMYDTFHAKEWVTSARPYLHLQPQVSHRMRAILVDWLVEVHLKFRLTPETLYLAVNLVDRFLRCDVIERCELQLVGVSSLMIAAKYEEIYPLGLDDLVYICDGAYSRRDVSLILEVGDVQLVSLLTKSITAVRRRYWTWKPTFSKLWNIMSLFIVPTGF
jgi:Cyclin, N-terminal domain